MPTVTDVRPAPAHGGGSLNAAAARAAMLVPAGTCLRPRCQRPRKAGQVTCAACWQEAGPGHRDAVAAAAASYRTAVVRAVGSLPPLPEPAP